MPSTHATRPKTLLNSSELAEIFAAIPLLQSLDATQRALLADVSQPLRVAKHEYVYHRGDTPQGLFIVVNGHIKVLVPSDSGHEKIIEFFSAGQAFGEIYLFLEQPYAVAAQALQDSQLIYLEKKDIFSAIARDPTFARGLLAGMARRMHTLVQDIEGVSLQSSAQRVVSYLLSLPREHGLLRLPIKKNVIASKLGLTPETFSRMLSQLSQSGLISVDGKEVLIHDEAALIAASR
jgi:CRP-like cAMP-binding protein